jgi:hypothetical protein
VQGNGFMIFVPDGYTSGTVLNSMATFDGVTIASLGLTPGTYVWTWGTAADQSFTLEIGQTPLPAALPLFATGLGLLGWRRKRKARHNLFDLTIPALAPWPRSAASVAR